MRRSFSKWGLLLICSLLSFTGCERGKSDECKRFAIVIPSYNNEKYVEWNLMSALKQKYDNFYVIYVNDCSKDQTASKVREIITREGAEDRVIFVDNKTRCGALKNIYLAIHTYTDDSDIVVTLDGDDAFSHRNVLKRLNQVYSNPKKEVWMSYGQFREKNSRKLGFCVEIPENVIRNRTYRQYQNIPSHLRTFYAWLFKNIKEEDLKYRGTFYEMSWDIAFMMPMIEMSGVRFECMKEVLYTYNDNNPISDHVVDIQKQQTLSTHIRLQKPYDLLDSPPKHLIAKRSS